MKTNKSILKLLLLTPAILIVACGGNASSSEIPSSSATPSSKPESSVASSIVSSSEIPSSSAIPSSRDPASRKNPIIIELDNPGTTASTELKAPFTILTEDGENATISGGNVFTNMYEAIRVAGANSTSAKKLQVQDENFVQVFKREKKAICYVFDKENYVGTTGQATAKKYCLEHPTSYAINGNASDYYYLGRDDMIEGQSVTENILETSAGAYNYMFSRGGINVKNLGYRYCTADVLLSQATYAPPKDGGTWNAYIFINLAEGISADLGLIGHFTGSRLEWWCFRSCSSSCHGSGSSEEEAHFYVYQNSTVTASTKYDSKTNLYSGFDDLRFETLTLNDGWICNVTNLRTGKLMYQLDHHHKNSKGEAVIENNYPMSARVLIASSYCPVTLTVWNWKSRAAFNNCIWTNILMKKAIMLEDGSYSSNIEDYRNETTAYPLYPDEPTYRDGYSQGAWRASHVFSTFEQSGETPTGTKYEAGQKYISYSVDYGNQN